MAGDWIKMRVHLRNDPKVIFMANWMASQREFMDWLTDPVRATCKDSAYEHVTRRVTVAVTVDALLVTWGVTREQGTRVGDDLVMSCCNAEIVSAIADVPCFGEAMVRVGWLVEDYENNSASFPNFFADKDSPEVRHRTSNAERQARYRNRRNASNVTSNVTEGVTRNVTSNAESNGEKRREEKNNKRARTTFVPPTLEEVKAYCQERNNSVDPVAFHAHYEANGWVQGKGQGRPIKNWRAAVHTWESNGIHNGVNTKPKQMIVQME